MTDLDDLLGLKAPTAKAPAEDPMGSAPSQGSSGDLDDLLGIQSPMSGGAPKHKFAKDPSFLEQVLEGLDYAGNISRSAIAGGLSDKGSALDWAWQAAKKDRKTTSTDLKDIAFGKRRMGKDDDKFDPGDIGDFAVDLGIDIATDPLTWLTAGVGSIAKGGKLAKFAPELSKGMQELKAAKLTQGPLSPTAIKAQTALTGMKTGVGGVMGLGAAPEDSGVLETLAYGAGGAAMGLGVGKLPGSRIAASGKRLMDKAGDEYVRIVRGDDWYAKNVTNKGFQSWSDALERAKEGRELKDSFASKLTEGREEVLGDLAPAERVHFQKNILEPLNTEFVKNRNLSVAAFEKSDVFKRMAKLYGQKAGIVDEEAAAEAFRKSENYKRIFNNYTEKATREVERDYLPGLMKNESDVMKTKLKEWEQFTQKTVSDINEFGFKLPNVDGVAKWNKKSGKGIVGIKWHLYDAYRPEEFKEVDNLLNKIKKASSPFFGAKKKMERSTAVEDIAKVISERDKIPMDEAMNIAYDKVYNQVYAPQMARKFLDQKSKDAMKAMREFANARGGYVEGWDKFTHWMKANQLYFSVNWLKTNYWDNMTKAFAQNGIFSAMDTASLGAFKNGIAKDVFKFMKNESVEGLKNEKLLREAVEDGVISGHNFKAITDPDVEWLKSSKASLTEEVGKETPETLAQKGLRTIGEAANWWTNKLEKSVGRLGSTMEGSARLMTYMHMKDALRKAPHLKDLPEMEIRQMAAKVSRDTFYDYDNISFLERETLRRIIPYYSFYSKNVPYWIGATFDPQRVGRIASVEKARHNIGDDPTERERMGMQNYIANNAPRKLGRDSQGNMLYGVMPSMSQYDAIKMANPLEWWGQIKEKIHPVAKLPVEAISGTDTFTGGPVAPSGSMSGKKFLFSRGFKWKGLQEAAELAGAPNNFMNVGVDKHGNPFTTSDTLVWGDKLASLLFPHGAVDQVAGSIGKMVEGKETATEVGINRASPLQIIQISPTQMRMVAQEKKRKEKRERRLDREMDVGH